jgi:CBS domain-containing protein
VADLRPRGLARAEDELVEELDREQDRDEAGGSAPARVSGSTGRAREAHRPHCVPVWRRCHAGTSTASKERGLMAQSIRELMTQNPRTVSPDSTIVDAAKIMRDEDTGVVPIVEGDRLVGVLTDRDIAIRVVAEGKDVQGTRVSEIASQDLVTIDPQQDLDEALRLMAQHQVRRLPVVEEDGRLVGIVAQADVARHASAERTGEVVEEISD